MAESNLYSIDRGALGSGGTILRVTQTHEVGESCLRHPTCLSAGHSAMADAFGGRIDGTSPLAIR